MITIQIIEVTETKTVAVNNDRAQVAVEITQGRGPAGIGGGTPSYQRLTATGTTLTFVDVPAAYDDYMIFRNGALLDPVFHYTTTGNDVEIPSVDVDDKITFRRIK